MKILKILLFILLFASPAFAQDYAMNVAIVGGGVTAAAQTCTAYKSGGSGLVDRGLGSAAGYYFLGQTVTDNTGAKICQACFYIHTITGTPGSEVVTMKIYPITTGTPRTLNLASPLASVNRNLSTLSAATLECWDIASPYATLSGGLNDQYFIGLTMGVGNATVYPNLYFAVSNTDGGYGNESEYVAAGTLASEDTGYDFYYSVKSMQ